MIVLLSAAHAATLTVDAGGGADFTSIDDAIDAASSGDSISVAPGTYAESINYDGKTLSISSTGGSSVTILDAEGGASWAVRILSGEGVGTALIGFTVRNETYSGAYLSGATVLFEDVVFEDLGYSGSADNASLDYGGAVRIISGTYTFTGVDFDDCQAKLDGGALFIDDGDVTLTNTTIDGGSAGGSGGGVYMANGTLTLEGSSVINSSSGGGGGAIFTTATLIATDSSFLNNQATDSASDGGALHLSSATATLSGLTLSDNAAHNGSGGAIWAEGSTALTISGSTFSRNSVSRNGGHIGLSVLSEAITIEDSLLENGRADTYGGGLSGTTNASVLLSGVSFIGNKATDHGGGVYLASGSTLDGDDCTFSGNLAEEGSGGGLYVFSVSGSRGLVLTNSIISDNAAKFQGGGLSADNLGQLSLSEVTFSGNSGLFEGTIGGGLYASAVADLWIHQSRFSNNEASIGAGAYAFSSPGSWKNNIFWENHAEVAGALSLSKSSTDLINNTFAGNTATREAFGLALFEISGEVSNNIFSHHDGDAIYVYDPLTVTATTLSYNGWYANTTDLAGEPWSTSATALSADPRYASWPTPTAFNTASFVLAYDSGLINVGDPELLDPDGSPSDVGAWGGPDLLSVDGDSDGYYSSTDCDDDDPSVYPGAEETWYDGDQSDCFPDDDYDADGDGEASDSYGGTDCDDTDPDITDDCVTDTGEGSGKGCQGCSSGGGRSGMLGVIGLWMLALLTSRARRSS
ncbi:MAG: hypothetical protein ACI8RZ_003208 [Myxococcota bacterium]|jgi:hypothetical protein